MSKMHALSIGVMIILLVPMVSVVLSITAETSGVMDDEVSSDAAEDSVDIITAGAGGEDSLVTNIAWNPGFEETDSGGGPANWGYWNSQYRLTNISYKDDVHGGSNAARMRVKGIQSYADTYLYQYVSSEYPYLSNGLDLDMWWKTVSIPDMAMGSRSYIQLELYNLTSWYYLYYNLQYGISFGPGNGSNTCNFMLNGTTGSWNHLSRDIASDFSSYFGGTGSFYMTNMYIFISSPSQATDVAEFLVDDVQLENSTSYDFMDNGDFEGTAGWGYSNEAPGYVMTTTAVQTEGARAANITVKNSAEAHYSYANMEFYLGYPHGFHPMTAGQTVLEFDWMYDDAADGGSNQQAFLRLYYENESAWFEIDYMLGQAYDTTTLTNSSSRLILFAPGFGARGEWNHFHIDMYELTQYLNLTDGVFDDIVFYSSTGNTDHSSVSLLIDDFQMRTYPTRDPGFEQDWYWSTSYSIVGWSAGGQASPYRNITTDAHSGKYAANLTGWEDSTTYIYQSMFVPIDEDFYTDFWWRLDDLHGTGGAASYIRLDFEGGYQIYYITASINLGSYSNTSNHLYFIVDGFNDTGSWNNLVRNPYRELQNAFGAHSWNLTTTTMVAWSSTGCNISILYDDMHFVVDTHAPAITDVTVETVDPMYYEPVLISADISDLGVVSADLFFNNGSWHEVPMSPVGERYEGWITPTPYGIELQYYITAEDYGGRTATNDNGGSYFSYSVGDDVDPTITINDPDDSDTVEGIVIFDVTVSDPGSGSSGISELELWEGSVLLLTDASAPWELEWNSRTVVNGTHILGIKVTDAAGNSVTDYITVIVENDQTGPAVSDVILNPTTPAYGEDVELSVFVTDHTAVKNVTLYWRANSGSWNIAEMEEDGLLYTAMITGQPWDTEIEYYVLAYDTFGLSSEIGSSTEPLSYTVGDNTPPVVSLSGPPTTVELSGVVQFMMSASDPGSGIHDYSFEAIPQGGAGIAISSGILNSDSVVNLAMPLDTTTMQNGNYTFVLVVNDGAGNSITFEYEYAVHNPVGIDAIGSALSELMASYGFVIGVGSVLLAVVVIQILLKKRRGS